MTMTKEQAQQQLLHRQGLAANIPALKRISLELSNAALLHGLDTTGLTLDDHAKPPAPEPVAELPPRNFSPEQVEWLQLPERIRQRLTAVIPAKAPTHLGYTGDLAPFLEWIELVCVRLGWLEIWVASHDPGWWRLQIVPGTPLDRKAQGRSWEAISQGDNLVETFSEMAGHIQAGGALPTLGEMVKAEQARLSALAKFFEQALRNHANQN